MRYSIKCEMEFTKRQKWTHLPDFLKDEHVCRLHCSYQSEIVDLQKVFENVRHGEDRTVHCSINDTT